MSIDSSADWDGLRAVSSVVSQTLTLLARTIEQRLEPYFFVNDGELAVPTAVQREFEPRHLDGSC